MNVRNTLKSVCQWFMEISINQRDKMTNTHLKIHSPVTKIVRKLTNTRELEKWQIYPAQLNCNECSHPSHPFNHRLFQVCFYMILFPSKTYTAYEWLTLVAEISNNTRLAWQFLQKLRKTPARHSSIIIEKYGGLCFRPSSYLIKFCLFKKLEIVATIIMCRGQ